MIVMYVQNIRRNILCELLEGENNNCLQKYKNLVY